MTAATIKFKRIRPRRWIGNRMGYDPCEYFVMRGGVQVGRIHFGVVDWILDGDAGRKRFRTLARAKEAALNQFEKYDNEAS